MALVATKFVAILSPILQAWAVDDLAGSGLPEFALGAIGLTIAYGMARIATISVYVWFTFAITEWRVKLRRKMNEQDTDANQKAIDSLLNFEIVKYFNAAGREAARYDEAMAACEAAALKTS